MDPGKKILPFEALPAWRARARTAGRVVVATNGCFDLLHVGHITYLHQAKALGHLLVVGVNGDNSVRLLKGVGRPINPEADRAFVVAALEVVDAVVVFPDLRATRFLAAVVPDIYVKGGDYSIDSLDREERTVVEQAGGRIVLLPLVPGKSTTAIAAKLAELPPGDNSGA